MKRIGVFVVAVALFAPVASADDDFLMTPIGDPVPGESWTQTWGASGVGTFNLIGFKSTPPAFESPGLSAITAAGWSTLIDTTEIVSMGGPGVDSLTFKMHFVGSPGDYSPGSPLQWESAIFRGVETSPFYRGRAVWNGSTWAGSATGTWTPTRAEVIPAPAAVLLGVMGVGMVGWLTRRARKAKG